MWSTFKKSFDTWERSAAASFQTALESPDVLGPAGWVLTGLAHLRDGRDRMVAAFWEELGLPTRRQQERTLHLLQQLDSRLLDLEDRLSDSAPRSGA